MQIEIIARGVIRRNGKILLCNPVGQSWYFFPGGHVEFFEKAPKSLARELQEETGARATDIKLIGLIENIYGAKTKRHELNLFFEAQIGGHFIVSKENHIRFEWLEEKRFAKARILPVAAKQKVAQWLKNKKYFSNLSKG